MLVLTRRRGEGITVGREVRVVVLGVKGGQVRLGVEAPRCMEIHREEWHARIQEQNKFAASAPGLSAEAIEMFLARFGSARW